MLAWSETITGRRRNPGNHGYDVIAGGELFRAPITLANLSPLKPKTPINRRRTLSGRVGGMPTASSLA